MGRRARVVRVARRPSCHHHVRRRGHITAVWLGANNRNASSGFQWVTGEPFDYAEWGPGEPNNTNGVEYYLMLMKREGTGWVWNDSRLDGLNNFPENARGFVCEWEEASP